MKSVRVVIEFYILKLMKNNVCHTRVFSGQNIICLFNKYVFACLKTNNYRMF